MIVFHGSDLTWAVRIKSTAEALGIPARPVRSIDMLDARLAEGQGDDPVGALIADLAAPEVALTLIERAAEENRRRSEKRGAIAGSPEGASPEAGETAGSLPTIRILAFGPHVEVEALQQARDLGAHEVMSRGAFSANLPDILVRLNG